MPPLPAPGQVIRLQFNIGDNASIQAGSRVFISYTGGPPTTTDLNTFCSDIAGNWGSNMSDVISDTESLHGIIATDLATDTGAIGAWAGSVNGLLSTGDPLTANAAVVVNHQINRRYRGGRPRTYVRAGDTGSLATGSTNEWSTGFMSEVLSKWEAIIAYVLARSFTSFTASNIVNVSWFSGNTVFIGSTGRAHNIPVKRVTPRVDPIVSSSVAQKVGSQRRRLDI